MLRLKKVAISALKQCGRLDLPSIAFASSITEALPENAAAFFGDTRKEAPLFLLPQNKSACIFIGPEKGFSPAELTILENMPACGMRLNANILRCETAAITAAAIAGYATERNNDDYQN